LDIRINIARIREVDKTSTYRKPNKKRCINQVMNDLKGLREEVITEDLGDRE